MNTNLQELHNAILEGQRDIAQQQVQSALDQGVEPSRLLDTMITAMAEVGRLFEEGEYYVPEMLIAARAMKTGMDILKPKLVDADIQPVGLVVIGTVKGDLHDIGKNLVSMMLEGAGFQVLDLGADVAPEVFVAAVQEHKPGIIAMSALLTTTMGSMKTTIEALNAAGLRDQVKVMVGGAPITNSYAQQIGADGYAEDASRAARLAKSLLTQAG
jgi:5-methyltetrahydrofolate--homocysteine methyltransferase